MTDSPPPGRGRRRGRGEAEPTEELGWIADLRSARESRTQLGPGPQDEDEPAGPRFGRRARRQATEQAGTGRAARRQATEQAGAGTGVPVQRPTSGPPAPIPRPVSGPPIPAVMPPVRQPNPPPVTPPIAQPDSRSSDPAGRPSTPGSRFVSVRGVRGNTGAQPPVPPPAAPPPATPTSGARHSDPRQDGEPRHPDDSRPPAASSGKPPRTPPVNRASLRFAPVDKLPDDTRRRRLLALAGLVLVLLVALPAVLLVWNSVRDPLTTSLDSLALPGWAAVGREDQTSGSRWCVKTCRWHERTWRSSKPAAQTDPVYRSALAAVGWTPLRTGCPAGGAGTGSYSCWQREQYRLDLWTRDAPCGLAGVAPSPGTSLPSAAPSASGDVLSDPGVSPSAPPPTCPGALVTAKVATRIDQHWQDR